MKTASIIFLFTLLWLILILVTLILITLIAFPTTNKN